jgi:hypothetical protein
MKIVELEGIEYVELEQFSMPIRIPVSGLSESDVEKFRMFDGLLADAKKMLKE